jgi:hypothetical protein
MMQVMKVLGVPETPGEHVLKVFKMQREHRIEMVLPTLKELGIQPTPYEQFARDYVAGRTTGGNSFPAPDTLFVRLFNAFGVLDGTHASKSTQAKIHPGHRCVRESYHVHA